MKTKKLLFFIAIAFVISLFACDSDVNECTQSMLEISYPTVDDLSPFHESPLMGNADMFVGELPEIPQELSEIFVQNEDGKCTYLGQTYSEVVFPYPQFSFVDWCGWQLDCNYLQVLGQTASQEIVYATNDQNQEILSLLLVGPNNTTFSWYVLEGSDLLNTCGYAVSDFAVQKIQGGDDDRFTCEQIWDYHTGKKYTDIRVASIDHPEQHTFFLRSKKNPWLVYELNYSVTYDYLSSSDYFVYIHNVPNDGMILLRFSPEA